MTDIRQVPNSAPRGDAYRELALVTNRLAQVSQPFHSIRTTSNITADRTYGFYLCDASSAAVTVTLPMAGAYKGVRFYVKKLDSSANAVTIDGNGSETIDGSATQVITTQYICLTVMSDGTQWWIV